MIGKRDDEEDIIRDIHKIVPELLGNWELGIKASKNFEKNTAIDSDKLDLYIKEWSII